MITIKKIFFIFICSVPFILRGQNNIVVAKCSKQNCEFRSDTLMLKEIYRKLVMDADIKDINKDNFHFDKISIEKGLLKKERSGLGTDIEYYFLMCRNYKLRMKVAIILNERNNKLVLFNNRRVSDKEMELNNSFLICYATDDDCFPILYFENGQKYWTSTSSPTYFCDPDGPCKQLYGMRDF